MKYKTWNENPHFADRLLKLADFLDVMDKERFHFGSFVSQKEENKCGTVCCALGWLPRLFPEHCKWDKFITTVELIDNPQIEGFDFAEHFFGLNMEEGYFLFNPGGGFTSRGGNNLEYDATPKEVADHIRWFVYGKKNGFIRIK